MEPTWKFLRYSVMTSTNWPKSNPQASITKGSFPKKFASPLDCPMKISHGFKSPPVYAFCLQCMDSEKSPTDWKGSP